MLAVLVISARMRALQADQQTGDVSEEVKPFDYFILAICFTVVKNVIVLRAHALRLLLPHPWLLLLFPCEQNRSTPVIRVQGYNKSVVERLLLTYQQHCRGGCLGRQEVNSIDTGLVLATSSRLGICFINCQVFDARTTWVSLSRR